MSGVKYTQYAFIPIRFADPVSAMQVKNNHLVFGTMMGRITNFELRSKKINLLEESSHENISDISFDPEGNCDVGVGDEKVLRYTFDENVRDSKPRMQKFDLYFNPSEHNLKCENCYTMLSRGAMFKVQLCQPDEGNVIIKSINADIEYKEQINNNQKEMKKLEMTNYSVPLDFFDNKFLWVEYLSEIERKFCIVNLSNIETPYKKLIHKTFGHISHCRILRDGRVFLVRSLNQCEIRRLDETFSLCTSFTHIGEEVYAIDIVYDDELSHNIREENDEECLQVNVVGKEDDMNPKEKGKNNSNEGNKNEYSENIQNGPANQINVTVEKKEEVNFTVVLLDIDGGVNTWRDDKITQQFNLYDIPNIDQDQKDKQFFSLGYAYYIRYDGNFFIISSDHGCYIITKSGNEY